MEKILFVGWWHLLLSDGLQTLKQVLRPTRDSMIFIQRCRAQRAGTAFTVYHTLLKRYSQRAAPFADHRCVVHLQLSRRAPRNLLFLWEMVLANTWRSFVLSEDDLRIDFVET